MSWTHHDDHAMCGRMAIHIRHLNERGNLAAFGQPWPGAWVSVARIRRQAVKHRCKVCGGYDDIQGYGRCSKCAYASLIWRCAECGNPELQEYVRAWIYPNRPTEVAEFDYDANSEFWCNDCDEEVNAARGYGHGHAWALRHVGLAEWSEEPAA